MLLSIVVGSLLASTALGRPADFHLMPNGGVIDASDPSPASSSSSNTRKPVPKTTFGTIGESQGSASTQVEDHGSATHANPTTSSVASTSAQVTSTPGETNSQGSSSLSTETQHTASRTSFSGFSFTSRPRPTVSGYTGFAGGGRGGRSRTATRTGGFFDGFGLFGPKSTGSRSEPFGFFGPPRARTTSVASPASRSRATAKSTAVSERPQSTSTGSKENGLAGWESKMKNPTFQIILSGVPDLKSNAMSITPDVDIYDIDLFMTEASTIKTLKRLNKTVICYFSAGTYEPGRPDSSKYAASDKGNRLLQWPSERWVKLSSPGIRRLITDRIQLAQQKGCDAIDPDNIDGYGERGGGLSLKRLDSVQFVQWMSQITAKYNLAVGLKNAMELLSDVSKNVQFAVNEECVKNNECTKYVDFVHKHNKPVFHIEYPLVNLERKPIDMERKRFCAEYTPSITGKNFQSVIKLKKLNGWVVYCDGKQWKTPTVDRGASRFSGRSNYVVTSNLTELEGAGARNRVVDMSPDPEPNPDPSPEVSTLDSAAIQAEIARQDGFPFPPGKGSDQFISDEELMAYDLDVSSPDSLEHAPETADANQPSEMSRQPSESPFEHLDESR